MVCLSPLLISTVKIYWKSCLIIIGEENPPVFEPAFNTLLFTVLLTAMVFARWGDSPFLYIVDHYIEFITASLIMSVTQAVYCYLVSFRPGRILALGGNSGNLIYDVRSISLWFEKAWRISNPIDRLLHVFLSGSSVVTSTQESPTSISKLLTRCGQVWSYGPCWTSAGSWNKCTTLGSPPTASCWHLFSSFGMSLMPNSMK